MPIVITSPDGLKNEAFAKLLPAWAQLNASASQEDSFFAAGAGLIAFANAIKAAPSYEGCFAQRLALAATAAVLRAQGRPEREDDIRDQWAFRAGELHSPAAAVFGSFIAMMKPRNGFRGVSPEIVVAVAAGLGKPLNAAPADLIQSVDGAIAETSNPVMAAAVAAQTIFRSEENEALAHVFADWVLAHRLGLPSARPMLGSKIAAPLVRIDAGRRPVPSDRGWAQAVASSYAVSCAAAIATNAQLMLQADRLAQGVARLRTRDAEKLMASVLENDCIRPGADGPGVSTRARQRFCERLKDMNALKELTGRDVSRLYGL